MYRKRRKSKRPKDPKGERGSSLRRALAGLSRKGSRRRPGKRSTVNVYRGGTVGQQKKSGTLESGLDGSTMRKGPRNAGFTEGMGWEGE